MTAATRGDGRADPLGGPIALIELQATSTSRFDRHWNYLDRIPVRSGFVILSGFLSAVILWLGVESIVPIEWNRAVRLETTSQLPPPRPEQFEPFFFGDVPVARIPEPTVFPDAAEMILSLLREHGIRCSLVGPSGKVLYVSARDETRARRLIRENFPSVDLIDIQRWPVAT